jgi:flagellar biosynthesis/type III secretory pathway M-ring protein FliF/YscJ
VKSNKRGRILLKPGSGAGSQKPDREADRPKTREDYIRRLAEEDPKRAAEIIREILKKK